MILWRRLDVPGHEVAELRRLSHGWELAGLALLALDGQPCRLDYVIDCDASWSTRRASVRANFGGDLRSLDVSRDVSGEWTANGVRMPTLIGCVDIDFGFSPSTNLLPIRRLRLAVGARAEVRAAWVRFPELAVEVLDQSYVRKAESMYHYESAGGRFERELLVDAEGFILEYPGLWRAEARTDVPSD